MSYYDDGVDCLESAKDNLKAGRYKKCVADCSMAVDVFLKYRLVEIDPMHELEGGHRHIEIMNVLLSRWPGKSVKDLKFIARRSSKYIRDAKYSGRFVSSPDSTYTESFAIDFIMYVETIRKYVDEECVGTSIEETIRKSP